VGEKKYPPYTHLGSGRVQVSSTDKKSSPYPIISNQILIPELSSLFSSGLEAIYEKAMLFQWSGGIALGGPKTSLKILYLFSLLLVLFCFYFEDQKYIHFSFLYIYFVNCFCTYLTFHDHEDTSRSPKGKWGTASPSC
jgi:hypothetical protein